MIPFSSLGRAKSVFIFIGHVLSDFRANQGLLLSGAIAYYTLLSIIPLFTLALVVSSHFFTEQQMIALLRDNLELVVPGLTDTLLDQVSKFLQFREVISWVGIIVMLFFSSMAFTVLENTMSVIFYHRVVIARRHFLVSAILPYLFVLVLGLGLLLITFIAGALQALDSDVITLFAWKIELRGITHILLYLLGVLGLVLLLTAIYMVMPLGNMSFRHALLGGIAAAVLWEIARHLLIWYFSTLSLVNLVYGSLATAIVTLLSLEVAGLILLLGAQVIATYERRDGGSEVGDNHFRLGD
ncbi:MAG: YihY/virulence factor BrkB family protein [Candidatus Thiodiazotropha sp.]